ETKRFSAIVDLLMCVGHVDGAYTPPARAFVRQYVDTVVRALEQGPTDAGPSAARPAPSSEVDAELGLQHREPVSGRVAGPRQPGAFRLAGITDISQLPAGARFLDGFVHVIRPDAPVELVVLGDLHGCYSCLKAALLQSGFIERAWAHQWDPARYPDVKLVLL